MPQASDELRAKVAALFGDPIDDHGPYNLLTKRGYKETAGLFHTKPAPQHIITEEERTCLDFLCDEWDYDYDFSQKDPPQ